MDDDFERNTNSLLIEHERNQTEEEILKQVIESSKKDLGQTIANVPIDALKTKKKPEQVAIERAIAVQQLQLMGFDKERAKTAWTKAEGDLNKAIEVLTLEQESMTDLVFYY